MDREREFINHSEALQYAIDNCPKYGKIICLGEFVIDKPIVPRSFVSLFCFAYFKVADGANVPIFERLGTSPPLIDFRLVGGVFDGNALGQSSNVFAVINIAGQYLKNVEICNISVLNACSHAIRLAEGNPSSYIKIVRRCFVYNIANKSIGYGIYCDYCPNTIIEENVIEPTRSVDSIELGHGEYICRNNIVIGSENSPTTINFPYASNSIIEGNIVYYGSIQNDGATANNVKIINNIVINAKPATGFAGIRVSGDNAIIENNYVSILNDQSGIKVIGKYSRIVNNNIYQKSGTVQGVGIKLELHYGDVIINNYVNGFDRGIEIDHDYSKIFFNTIENCNTGIRLVPTETSGHKMIGNRIMNNTFINVTTRIDPTNQLDGNMIEDIIYTSLPTYTEGYEKGDKILYYDGTYYYIAVWNGSSWLKVQLS